MRIVFMGTPELAASILAGLAESHDVVAVYTRPDAVRKRGKTLVASPVKQAALDRGIEVFTPDTLRDEQVIEQLRELAPDAICVAAYGAILPREVLEIPRYGCLNVHTSLLPRWRGAAPMQRAILEGDNVTGVCIMKMEEGLDTGAFCKRVELPIEALCLCDLEECLATSGSKALLEALYEIEQGTVMWTEQSQDDITYAAKIEKGELSLSPEEGAMRSCAKVRASDSAHPARAVLAGRSVTVEQACFVREPGDLELCADLKAGDLVFRSKRLFAGCDNGVLEILRVKPDGKNSMDARSFAGGIQGIKGTTLQWESC